MRIRFLPPDTPGLPPSVPTVNNGGRLEYRDDLACQAVIWAVDHPSLMTYFDDIFSGAYCTREARHPEHEVHICHLRTETEHAPEQVIVWGGE